MTMRTSLFFSFLFTSRGLFETIIDREKKFNQKSVYFSKTSNKLNRMGAGLCYISARELRTYTTEGVRRSFVRVKHTVDGRAGAAHHRKERTVFSA